MKVFRILPQLCSASAPVVVAGLLIAGCTSSITSPVSPTDSTSGSLRIDSVSPHAGRPGSHVTIYGSGFGADPKALTVQFGSAAATVVSAEPTKIVTSIPDQRGAYPIYVTRAKKTVQSADNVTIWNGGILGLSSSNGFPGDSLILTTFDYGPYSGTIKVFVGSHQAAIRSVTATRIVFLLPDAIGTSDTLYLEYTDDNVRYARAYPITIFSRLSFFSAIRVEWSNLTLQVSHTIYLSPDSTFIATEPRSQQCVFRPSAVTVDKNGVSTATLHVSITDGAAGSFSGLTKIDTSFSCTFRIDTTSGMLTDFAFSLGCQRSFSGEACLGCGSNDQKNNITLQLLPVPIRRLPNGDLVASLDAASIATAISTFQTNGSDQGSGYYHQQPGSSYSSLGLTAQPVNAIVKITFIP